MARLFTLLLIFGYLGMVDNALADPIKLYLSLTTYQIPDTSFVKDGQATNGYNVRVEANLSPIDSTQVRLLLTKPLIVKALRNGAETTVVLRYLDIDVGPDNTGLMEYISKMSSGPHFYLSESDGSRDEFLAASANGSLIAFAYKRNGLPHILMLDNHLSFYVNFEELIKSKVVLPNTRISFSKVLDVKPDVVQIDSSSRSIDYTYLGHYRISSTDVFEEKNLDLLKRLRKVWDLYFQMHPPFIGTYTDDNGRKMIFIKKPTDPLDNVVQLTGNKCADIFTP